METINITKKEFEEAVLEMVNIIHHRRPENEKQKIIQTIRNDFDGHENGLPFVKENILQLAAETYVTDIFWQC
jgi:hypothetical protein